MMNGLTSNSKSNQLLYRVYAWMTVGLGLTAAVSYYVASNPVLLNAILKNSGAILIIFLLQIGIVFALAFFLQKMSATIAVITFILYSILNGITFAGIFLIYTQSSIAIAFLVTAGMFAAMALYGFFTKADLSAMGSFLFMGLIGLIIALFVNVFLKSKTFDYIISGAGVVIFSLLTAYDVQQIKKMSNQLIIQGESLLKVSIIGALKLYLDFINLFLYILKFVGQKKEQ